MSESLESSDRPLTHEKFTRLFNRGFRRGANDRTAAGLQVSELVKRPGSLPPADEHCIGTRESEAWQEGYLMGYKVGASDAELASVDIPGACGMISGFSEEFLEIFGFFTGTAASENSDPK